MTKRFRERIYIVPTWYGLMYGGGILVALMCGAVYSNNLAYLLSFFLVALFIIGMHQSHINLKGLHVQKIQLDIVGSFQKGFGRIWIKSDSGDGHANLQIQGQNNKDSIQGHIQRIEKRALAIHNLQTRGEKRGKKHIPRIKISSRYPFGLFYVWRHFEVDEALYVFPSPQGYSELPAQSAPGNLIAQYPSNLGEDFTDHKPYETGESQKRVDWKAYARGRPLLTKRFTSGSTKAVHLALPRDGVPLEDQLSQVSKWIDDCDVSKVPYSFELGSIAFDVNLGNLHRVQCLKALAEYTVGAPK